MKIVDLRSDTVTRPTEEMRRAMAAAEVGDDVYGEDPTVQKLEELAAEMLGKEAGLFFPTGTMANQAAVMTHTRRGDEVIVEAESHVFYYEVGGMALLSGVQARTVPGRRGLPDVEAVALAIRGENVHFPRTGLVCLENTHNRAGGAVLPQDGVVAIGRLVAERGIPLHLDGARLFNAAVASGRRASELAAPATTVMISLSKGLSAPVGSLLAGPKDWIERAHKARKVLGGGMRQAGVIAAAGLVALTQMVDRLAEDHARARRLGEGLAQLGSLEVEPVETNMVIFRLRRGSAPALVEGMRARGVLANATGPTAVRLVTHREVDGADCDQALAVIAALLKE